MFFPAPRVTPGEGLRTVAGLLALSPNQFGIAQMDVDGGLTKAIGLAETVIGQPSIVGCSLRMKTASTTRRRLRRCEARGKPLFADDRALELLQTFDQSAKANTAATGNPPPGTDTRFFAEDLNLGYRLDIWDSTSNEWRSLHARNAVYNFGDLRLPRAMTKHSPKKVSCNSRLRLHPPKHGTQASTDLYLHEAIARLGRMEPECTVSRHSAEPLWRSGKSNPPDDPSDPDYVVDPRSNRSTYGQCIRSRQEHCPVCASGGRIDSAPDSWIWPVTGSPVILRSQAFCRFFSASAATRTPRYLRYQAAPSPVLIARSTDAVLLPGSAINRIVIRSFNDGVANDDIAPDLTANGRHERHRARASSFESSSACSTTAPAS